MNLALLSKLAWRIVTEPQALMSRVLQAKYGHSSNWLSPRSKGSSSSKLENGLVAGFNCLKENCIWEIGNGSFIAIGLDPWLPSPPDFIPRINPRYQELIDQPVRSLMLKKSRSWNRCKIRQIFHPQDVDAILTLKPPSSIRSDKLLWLPAASK